MTRAFQPAAHWSRLARCARLFVISAAIPTVAFAQTNVLPPGYGEAADGSSLKESSMLTERDSLKAYCNRELETCQRLLQDFEARRRKVGTYDGRSWTDTTAEESERLRARIAELAKLLSKMA
jgi:hypothetical protein